MISFIVAKGYIASFKCNKQNNQQNYIGRYDLLHDCFHIDFKFIISVQGNVFLFQKKNVLFYPNAKIHEVL